jgi:hypothetical protein
MKFMLSNKKKIVFIRYIIGFFFISLQTAIKHKQQRISTDFPSRLLT